MDNITSSFSSNTPLDSMSLITSLAVGIVLSLILKWHFGKCSRALVNRKDIGEIIPFITLIIILVISVVKSSLALSLGLVGALSIVRFRTPIKEPEELAYLFMAIAIGLGLGASQIFPTIIATTVILAVTYVLSRINFKSENSNVYISISMEKKEAYFDKINRLIDENTNSSEIRRVDQANDRYTLVYFADFENFEQMSKLTKLIESDFKGVEYSIIDQNRISNQ